MAQCEHWPACACGPSQGRHIKQLDPCGKPSKAQLRENVRAAEQRIRALNDELADACSALKTAKSELNKAMRAKH